MKLAIAVAIQMTLRTLYVIVLPVRVPRQEILLPSRNIFSFAFLEKLVLFPYGSKGNRVMDQIFFYYYFSYISCS